MCSLPFTIVARILGLLIIMDSIQQYGRPVLAKNYWLLFDLFLFLFIIKDNLLRFFLPLDLFFIEKRGLFLRQLMLCTATPTLACLKLENVHSDIFYVHVSQ
jgi:hypothetical protein